MTSTPESTGPLHNEALEELQAQDAEELVAPEEVVFDALSHPAPTDAIGSETWEDAPEAE